MEDRLSCAEMLERLDTEYRQLRRTLARLTREQMLQPNVIGVWSVKDMLAHLVFWNRFPVDEVGAALCGEFFVYPTRSSDEINARAVRLFQGKSLEETLIDFERSYGEVVALIETLPDEALEQDNPPEQSLDETIHGAFANNTYEHWLIHEAQVRKWLERQ